MDDWEKFKELRYEKRKFLKITCFHSIRGTGECRSGGEWRKQFNELNNINTGGILRLSAQRARSKKDNICFLDINRVLPQFSIICISDYKTDRLVIKSLKSFE